jgi:hypothetical protein
VRSRVAVIVVVCVVVCVVAAGFAVAGPSSRAGAQTAPRRVLVYGDSLTWEAQAGIEQAIEAQLPGWDAIVRTSPGVATCNTLPAMRGADGNLNAGVVVLEYVAVPFGPCMTGNDSLAQHTADTEAAISLWASRGVPVVLVGAPRGVGDPSDPVGAGAINRDLAARTGQTFVDTGVLLRDPWTGVYQQRLPCLDGEGAALGCGADGLIDVRDETGGHFCSIHNVGPCPVYASGVVRFAASIADAVARAARTSTVPPLPGPPAAATLGPSVRALLGGSDAARGPAANRRVATAAQLGDDVIPADFEAQPVATATTASLAGRECRAVRRALKDAGADGGRAEASFAAPGGGATIDEVVHVLPKAKDARGLLKAYKARTAATCFEHVLGVPVTVEPTSGVGDGATTFRATASRPFVIQVVRAGRAVTALTYANAVTPPPADAVTAITEAAVTRADAAQLTAPAR